MSRCSHTVSTAGRSPLPEIINLAAGFHATVSLVLAPRLYRQFLVNSARTIVFENKYVSRAILILSFFRSIVAFSGSVNCCGMYLGGHVAVLTAFSEPGASGISWERLSVEAFIYLKGGGEGAGKIEPYSWMCHSIAHDIRGGMYVEFLRGGELWDTKTGYACDCSASTLSRDPPCSSRMVSMEEGFRRRSGMLSGCRGVRTYRE